MLVIEKKHPSLRFLLVDHQGDSRALLETDGKVVTKVIATRENDEWDDYVGRQQRHLSSSYIQAIEVPSNHELLERPAE